MLPPPYVGDVIYGGPFLKKILFHIKRGGKFEICMKKKILTSRSKWNFGINRYDTTISIEFQENFF